jgi:hypothetical protein
MLSGRESPRMLRELYERSNSTGLNRTCINIVIYRHGQAVQKLGTFSSGVK